MKSKKIIFTLFLLLAVVQLLAPAKMIYNQEQIIKTGKAYKFLTQPLDPNDPLRGKYVRLNYQINRFKTSDTIWKKNHHAYVYLNDSIGFAKIDTVSHKKLNLPNDYVIADKYWFNQNNNTLRFNLPFGRFYMEESKAKPAEDLVRRNNREAINNTTCALVYIKEGKFVLKDVLINDESITDIIRKNSNN